MNNKNYKIEFLKHVKTHMDYLVEDNDMDEVSKIESMAYFILETIDNCSGFEPEIGISFNNEIMLDDQLLNEAFFKLNNEDLYNE